VQIRKIPKDATVLVVSCSGNDALEQLSKLYSSGISPWNVLVALKSVRTDIRQKYQNMLHQINMLGIPIIVCTVYKPYFSSVPLQLLCNLGIYFLNDMIVNETQKYGIPIIDIKAIFNNKMDYANSIEPGVPGGDKITNNIIKIIKEHDFNSKKQKIYTECTYTPQFNPKNYTPWSPQNNPIIISPLDSNHYFRRVIGDYQAWGYAGSALVILVGFFVDVALRF